MGDQDPHIYAVQEHTNQSIIIGGASGSEKTHSVGQIVHYFLNTNVNEKTNAASQVEKRVMASSTIMAAMGNARTARNNNSSRVGLFLKLFLEVRSVFIPEGVF